MTCRGARRARIHSDRFMLNWGWVQRRSEGSFNWASERTASSAPSPRTGSGRYPCCGETRGGSTALPPDPPLARPRDAQAWRNFLRAAVARYGPGGTYWATRYRQLYGPNATPLPIQAWQIWNEPNLNKYFAPYPSPRRVRPAAADLPQRDQEPGSQGPDRARRNARLRGRDGLGLPQGLYKVPGIKRRLRRRPHCTRTPADSTVHEADPASSAP